MARFVINWGAALLGILVVPSLLWAYQSPGRPQGLVSDFAELLPPAEQASLESQLEAYRQASGNELAVVTIASLGGDTIENFANELFAEWGIGGAKQDTGALLLVARDDRELRIEVGYGLEGDLTDAESSLIINRLITPRFKEGNYAAGITAGVEAIIKTLGGESVAAEAQSDANPLFDLLGQFGIWIFLPLFWLVSILARSKSWWAGGVLGALVALGLGWWQILGWWWLAPFTGVGLLFDWLVSRAYQKSKTAGVRPPWWAGGSGGFGRGGGGFGGFGGGHSGGGGASGRW